MVVQKYGSVPTSPGAQARSTGKVIFAEYVRRVEKMGGGGEGEG